MKYAIRLSCEDLGLFFEPRHEVLARDLVRIGEALLEEEERSRGARGPAGLAKLARELGEKHGLYGLLVPESLGGFPVGRASSATHVDVRALSLVREMLGQVCPIADAILAVQGLGSYPVVLAGSSAQRKAYLPRIVRGDAIGAFALTEPSAGSDVSSMTTLATRDGDSFVLDGEKTFISNVGIATHYVVFANANPSAGRKGITAFLVEHGTPGLSTEPIPMSIEHPIGKVSFEGCRIPATAMLGDLGAGFALAMKTLDTFRVSVAAAAVGMARRALGEAISHTRTRKQFGRPLAELPVLQGYLAEMATDVDAARLLVLRAAWLKDGGKERVSTEAAMAKLFATEAAQRVIDRAVQLFGGLGVVSTSIVEQLYREIRPLRIYEGTSEIQKLIIGSALA